MRVACPPVRRALSCTLGPPTPSQRRGSRGATTPHPYARGVADYISRALVADALSEWREQLRALAKASPLRDVGGGDIAVVDLTAAHPSGLAQLFAGRPTLVSALIRDQEAQPLALRRARAACEDAESVRLNTGIATGALVVGTALWSEGGATREVPILLRHVTLEPSRETDTQVTLHSAVTLNPILATEMRARAPESTVAELAEAVALAEEFDPRPVWNEVRSRSEAFGPDFEVREALILGSFDDPEQRLVDDVDECDHLVASSLLLASVAGDHTAREELTGPLPAVPMGDRDPFAERGLGDLDDRQFSALDLVATGRSLFVQVPPGGDAVATVVAIAADGAASGKSVAVVTGSVSAAEVIATAMAAAGVGDLCVSATGENWNTRARALLLESMTMASPRFDETALRAEGEELLAARAELRARYEDLHRTWAPWQTSAYEAVQALVRLTSQDRPPTTRVRLGATAVAYVAERGVDVVAAAVARAHAAQIEAERAESERAESERAASERAESDRVEAGESALAAVPPTAEGVAPRERRWWEGIVLDEARGAVVDEAFASFVAALLPHMRADAAEAAAEVGVDPAPSFSEWSDQLEVFYELRDTLDTFSPAVFQGSISDLIAATAPAGAPSGMHLTKRERRARVRRAEELMRPAREASLLHAQLVLAQRRLARWRAHSSQGGWPRVPDRADGYRERLADAHAAWSTVAPVIETKLGRGGLEYLPWDDLQRALAEASGADAAPIEAEHVREAHTHLDGADLGALLRDLAERDVAAADAAAEMEFAWWASAFDAIIAAQPSLADFGALGAAVDEYLERDRGFSRGRVRPLMRAVAERRRGAIARDQDAARDVFASLVEGGDGPIAALWGRFPAVASSLRPVSIFSAEQTSQVAPAARVLDTVVFSGVESLSFAQVVPALARASQVIVLADEHSATGTAVAQLRENLPVVRLRARPRPLDARVTAVLADHGYGRELEMLPAPGGGGSLELIEVDARGPSHPAPSTRAEVAAAIGVIAARSPEESVLVVCGSGEHADAVALAVAADPRTRHREIPVVALGEAAGLEADVVVLSTGFAPGADGSPAAGLGVLAGPAGASAMRQAIVAALRDVAVVTALSLSELADAAAEAPKGHGLDVLADLIAVAGAGPLEPAEQGARDWLLADIAARLRAEGLAVGVRYGVGGDVIPLVVGEGPAFTVAVVTDDALPAQGTSLRDQVRWQRSRLESLGWIVAPLWTLDAFVDPAAATAAILRVVGRTPRASVPDPEPEPFLVPDPESEHLLDPDPEPLPGFEQDPLPGLEQEPLPGFEQDPLPGFDREPILPRRSADDGDLGWGGSESRTSREEELRREVPPHW